MWTDTRIRQVGGLLGTIVAVNIIGASPAFVIETETNWFDQPPLYPPEILFPIVWTVLFSLMGIALWRLIRRRNRPGARRALIVFGVQFLFNLAWTPLFFGLRQPGIALVVIVGLLGAIVLTIVTADRVDRTAALLLVPYLLWVGFATVLNTAIVIGWD